MCDARVHYPIIKQQETNQLLSHPTGRRRLMPQTPNSVPYHLLALPPPPKGQTQAVVAFH